LLSRTIDRVRHAAVIASLDTQSLPLDIAIQAGSDLGMPKTNADIAREIDDRMLATSEDPIAGSRDVTARLLSDSAYGPGPLSRLVASAKPAKNVSQTPSLMAALSALRSRGDRSMGFVSMALAYSKAMPIGKRDHANLIRLIKGGYVRVCEVLGPPEPGGVAFRDARYADRHYMIHVGPCDGGSD
jgi:hypothetical protein